MVRLAAEQGHDYAQYSLGNMYRRGQGVPQDNVQAYKWFDLAASRNAGAFLDRDRVAAKMTPAQIAEAQKQVATSLNKLALLYHALGKHAEAEPLYQRALEIDEAALGSDHLDVAIDLSNLAALYDVQGKYAEPLLERALAILEKALGPEHPNVAQVLENYAALLRETGHPRDAAIMAARAKVIRAKHAQANPVN